MTQKKIIIFANGSLQNSQKAKDIASDAYFVICADGGAIHCANLDITPDLLIGDFDSVPKKIRKIFEKKHVEIKQYPVHKDYTDLELALQHAAKIIEKLERKEKNKNKTITHIIAGLGGRWDMSVATLLIAASAEYQNTKIIIHGEKESLQILTTGCHSISGKKGKRISFIPLCSDAKGVTLAGFEYAVNNITLSFGSSQGVSNTLIEESALVRIQKGVLMMILED